MELSASAVKELREKTGAGMMDCKKALAETGGDVQKAIDYLRQKGFSRGSEESRSGGGGWRGGRLCASGRQDRRARGNQLRNRFCRAHGGVSIAAQRYRHAGRGGQSALCAT